MKITRIALMLLLLGAVAQAAPVSLSTATSVALNWYAYTAPAGNDPAAITIKQTETIDAEGMVDYYLFTFTPTGFVIVSGNDATVPIIGYSHVSPIKTELTNPTVRAYFANIQAQMRWVRDEQIDNSATLPLWREILDGTLPPFERDRDVSPLLSTTWDQGCNYNNDCPTDGGGPCGHVWAGCVATAMGQVMKYWAAPAEGVGSHGYTHPDYGYQYANFGATTYNWASMPNGYGEADIQELLYHCGVAVNMDYGPDGSGAYVGWGPNSALHAFETYFDYNSSASFVEKDYYSTTTWENMMRSQLNNGRPMVYRGHGGGGGHAWVMDGYQGTNYFHMNWGWSGWANGYYYLNDLTPGSYSFTSDQGAIINLYPNQANTAPVVSDIPTQHLLEGDPFTPINLDDYVEDAESPDDQITWTYSGNVELSVSIVDRVATVTPPDENWNGTELITFRATDPGGLWDEDGAYFWLDPVNDPPFLDDIPNQYLMEGDSFAQINLDDYVEDDETPDESIIWSYYGNVELLVDITDRVATITAPDPDWYGLETITFVAEDWWALTSEDAATFWLQEVNDAPVVDDIPDQTINEGESFVDIPLDDYVADVDNPDEQITWLTSGEVDISVYIDPATRIATITYPGGWTGSETITFTAWDWGSLYDEDDATFTVLPGGVNDPPVVSDIPDQEIYQGESFAQIALDAYVEDDNTPDELIAWTYSGDTDLTVSIVDQVATITPPDGLWTGSETITFRATDEGDLWDEDPATFTVLATPNPVNDLVITVVGNDVLLEWSAVTGASAYSIYRLADPYDPVGILVDTTTGISYTIAGELPGLTEGFYFVRVVY